MAGHTFSHWNTKSDGFGSSINPGGTFVMGVQNVTLYAIYSPISTYTVTYNANGGSGTPPADGSTYTAGSNVTAAGAGSLSMTGYTFSHWNTQANGSGSSVAPGGTFVMGVQNVTLYARWTPKIYHNVIFNKNNSSAVGSMPNQQVEEGVSAALTANGFLVTGWTFAGWSTSPAGGVEYADGALYVMAASDVTLYAQWTPPAVYNVGDRGPAGGWIFYDDEADGLDDIPGKRYLEAATEDLVSSIWGDVNSTGAYSETIGTGSANTYILVGYYTTIFDTAAHRCVEYSTYNNGINFSDWFLPSSEELALMLNFFISKGITMPGAIYWSSTDISGFSMNSRACFSSDASLTGKPPEEIHSVRPVRAF